MDGWAKVIPVLHTKRLMLRPLRLEDAPALLRCWSDPRTARWLGIPPVETAEEASALVALLLQLAGEEQSLRWSVALPDGEALGTCGLNFWQLEGAYRGELGCELAPDAWGRGYMHEALQEVLRFGYGTMGLNRLEAYCHPDNTRAARLFERLGFVREGVLRQYRHTADGFQDAAVYALLRSEWVPGDR